MPSLGIPEITTQDLKQDSLATKLNDGLRLLSTHVMKVMGINGPQRFGDGAMTFPGDVSALASMNVTKKLTITGESDRAGNIRPIRLVNGLPEYADNATALAGGLTYGEFYRTATGTLMIVYEP
jgi:hypothetical protein